MPYLLLHNLIGRLILIVSSLFILFSCKKESPSALESALGLAGQNRVELEKVLTRYSQKDEDSLKYKAACFLIENMPFYSYFEGEALDAYFDYYKLLSESKESNKTPSEILEITMPNCSKFTLDSIVEKKDIETIDSAFLCNNIDWAFKVWREQPWCKNTSFDEFCEYILPYRIDDEKLESWREEYYEKYNDILAPLHDPINENGDDPVKAAQLIMDHLRSAKGAIFTTVAPANLPHVGPKIAQYVSGSCRELTDYAVYVCRALGIPCQVDFMPIRGNENVGHFWISYYDKNRELWAQDFPDGLRRVPADGIMYDPKTKVYRNTFSLNREMQKQMFELDSSFPSFFVDPKFVDVTFSYARRFIQDITIHASQLYVNDRKGKIGYLCVISKFGWVPVSWAKFEKAGITFTEIQKGDILRVASWEGQKLIFQSSPFTVDPNSNDISYYTPQSKTHDVILYSKFETGSEGLFRERMLGGVFEGSNDPHFLKKDTLRLINSMPERLNIRVNSKSTQKYRYVRYYGPNVSFCNISEAAFYSDENDSIPLQGKVIGTQGSIGLDHQYSNVFDGKSWTSFDSDLESGGWAGLDLGKKRLVSHIVFTPRNRDNYIRPGDKFELFCCDSTWKSLGVTVSSSDSLVYKDVPQGALLFLKCYSRGQQERAFIYENNRTIWK